MELKDFQYGKLVAFKQDFSSAETNPRCLIGMLTGITQNCFEEIIFTLIDQTGKERSIHHCNLFNISDLAIKGVRENREFKRVEYTLKGE